MKRKSSEQSPAFGMSQPSAHPYDYYVGKWVSIAYGQETIVGKLERMTQGFLELSAIVTPKFNRQRSYMRIEDCRTTITRESILVIQETTQGNVERYIAYVNSQSNQDPSEEIFTGSKKKKSSIIYAIKNARSIPAKIPAEMKGIAG